MDILKYVFHEQESYIFDALQFPGMIYYKEEAISKSEENFIEFIPESSKIVMKEMYDLILPYSEKAKIFYFEGNEDRDFIELLTLSNPFMGQEDPLDYLKTLLDKSDEELLFEVIFALDYFDQDTVDSDKEASRRKAEELKGKPEEIMPWLNALSIGNDAKWQLYSFTQNPRKTLEAYISFMEEVLPKFEKFYEKYRADIVERGNTFVKKLGETEGDSLSEVSNGIVSESVLIGEKIEVLITMVNSFSIMLNAGSVRPFIAWGSDIEKIFIAIKEKEADQVQERVTLFKNLGDKTRYEVLMNIAKGITSTKIIARNLGVSSATISYHLNNLVTAKLIYLAQNEGKYTYRVNHEFIGKCIKAMTEDLASE